MNPDGPGAGCEEPTITDAIRNAVTIIPNTNDFKSHSPNEAWWLLGVNCESLRPATAPPFSSPSLAPLSVSLSCEEPWQTTKNNQFFVFIRNKQQKTKNWLISTYLTRRRHRQCPAGSKLDLRTWQPHCSHSRHPQLKMKSLFKENSIRLRQNYKKIITTLLWLWVNNLGACLGDNLTRRQWFLLIASTQTFSISIWSFNTWITTI